jgi:hypothetical protein
MPEIHMIFRKSRLYIQVYTMVLLSWYLVAGSLKKLCYSHCFMVKIREMMGEFITCRIYPCCGLREIGLKWRSKREMREEGEGEECGEKGGLLFGREELCCSRSRRNAEGERERERERDQRQR